MIFNLLVLTLVLGFDMPEVPNYFPSYLQARDAAEKSKKPMLIFITGPDCSRCEAAWNAYSKDAQAVEKHISVRVDRQNFDGQVIAALYEAGHAPAWVLVDEKDNVKEKWTGGWKDAKGNPTVYIDPPGSPDVRTALVTTSIQQTDPVRSTPSSNTQPSVANKPKPVIEKTSALPVTTAVSTSGYVLQAGYFGSESNARKCISDLQVKGFDGYKIKSVVQNGSTFYRVISATYTTDTEAQSTADLMQVKGIKATVKKVSEL